MSGGGTQPLGSQSEAQDHLAAIFPGIKFVLERGEAAGGIQSLDLRSWMAKMSGVKYPCWAAIFEGDRFIISMRLEGETRVEAIRFTVYGHGIKAAKTHLEKLAARTGWRITF